MSHGFYLESPGDFILSGRRMRECCPHCKLRGTMNLTIIVKCKCSLNFFLLPKSLAEDLVRINS